MLAIIAILSLLGVFWALIYLASIIIGVYLIPLGVLLILYQQITCDEWRYR